MSHTVHSPTDSHLLTVRLKFTLKLDGFYMFRSLCCSGSVHCIRRAFGDLLEQVYESYSSFINRCTYIRTLIKIYIKIRWLLHVSVYDHHQGACN